VNAEELAAIRERANLIGFNGASITTAQQDRRALLAHIDALTAKVEGLGLDGPNLAFNTGSGPEPYVKLSAVLAILRGEA